MSFFWHLLIFECLSLLNQGFNYLSFLSLLPQAHFEPLLVIYILTLWTVLVLNLFFSVHTLVVVSILCSSYSFLSILLLDRHKCRLTLLISILNVTANLVFCHLNDFIPFVPVGSLSSVMLISPYTS